MVRGILSVILSLWLATVAQAGDMSRLNILGFAEDGAVFGFEEYGVQDGSGHAYATRTFIRAETDSFLSRTPLRVIADNEDTSLQSIRDEAASQAELATGLGDLAFSDSDHMVVFLSTALDASRPSDLARVLLDPYLPQTRAPLTITLRETQFAAREEVCFGFYDQETGFRLTLHSETAEYESRILHDDESVPASRGCPQTYRIGGVVTHPMANGMTAVAILIQFQKLGFEGPDSRWMAVTTVLPR